MIFLALDLGTSTGVAVGDPCGEPSFFTERLGEPGGKQGARFLQALAMTKKLITKHKPDLIVIELARASGSIGSQTVPQMGFGLRACVHAICFQTNTRVKEFAPNTVRKHFLGNGRIKRADAKKQTINECQMKGWQVDNDDEADALAMWDLASCKFGHRQSNRSGNLFEAAN